MGKMRQFQDLGHKAVLIIGDYTARIGDPTGANHMRPVLSEEQIEKNAKTYFEQAGRILDTAPAKLELRHNSEWLAKLTFADVLRLAARMTVARMLERDTFEKRHKAGDPIGVHEFLYPLMQAHDSVVIEADVELGGTDQTFNCLAGRELMRDAGMEPQIVLTMPLLVGLDGVEKMSKSKGNTIAVTDPAGEMFGKVMSIPDSLMENYWTLLTDRPLAEVQATLRSVHPRQAKEALAVDVAARYHGTDAARAAAEEFRRVFAEHKLPTQIPVHEITFVVEPGKEAKVGLAWLIRHVGLAKSNSDAMRKIEGGGVSIDEAPVSDPKMFISYRPDLRFNLRVGRKWVHIVLHFDFEQDPHGRF
jgi:tyrosyl-tRNA synthetase